jgi:FeS assembly SUF system protein
MGEAETVPAEPTPAPTEESVVDALKRVYDPEIPVNIYDLGLIYSINLSVEGEAKIVMTLTAPGCPVAGSLIADVERRVRAVPGITTAAVELVWEPPWRPEMMSKLARVMLGM